MTELGQRVWIKKTHLELSLGFEREMRFRELSPAHYLKSFTQNQAAHFSDCLVSPTSSIYKDLQTKWEKKGEITHSTGNTIECVLKEYRHMNYALLEWWFIWGLGRKATKGKVSVISF